MAISDIVAVARAFVENRCFRTKNSVLASLLISLRPCDTRGPNRLSFSGVVHLPGCRTGRLNRKNPWWHGFSAADRFARCGVVSHAFRESRDFGFCANMRAIGGTLCGRRLQNEYRPGLRPHFGARSAKAIFQSSEFSGRQVENVSKSADTGSHTVLVARIRNGRFRGRAGRHTRNEDFGIRGGRSRRTVRDRRLRIVWKDQASFADDTWVAQFMESARARADTGISAGARPSAMASMVKARGAKEANVPCP